MRLPGVAVALGWTRSQRCRTLAQDPLDIDLRDLVTIPLFQAIAAEAARMSARGDLPAVIASHLSVDPKTVKKALCWYGQR